jgi:hypothetical protein
MALRDNWDRIQRLPAVRTGLFATGLILMIGSPAVGLLPGPGGIIVFALGLGLSLKYSEWAKRKYVQFKRKHPRKGHWADWGLRRQSARRRHERLKERESGNLATSDD